MEDVKLLYNLQNTLRLLKMKSNKYIEETSSDTVLWLCLGYDKI